MMLLNSSSSCGSFASAGLPSSKFDSGLLRHYSSASVLHPGYRGSAATAVLASSRWSLASTFETRDADGGHELHVGSSVTIANRTFKVTGKLGQGSFSKVWSALPNDDCTEVAIKETFCKSAVELSDAEYEAKIMRLAKGLTKIVPELFTAEAKLLAKGQWNVRLLMTKCSGEALDAFLKRKKLQIGFHISAEAAACQCEQAMSFTLALLKQLVPAFESISTVVLHRDVNTHNILVDEGDNGENPRFHLIDFGLGVEQSGWMRMMTVSPVVGDCRFWPVSSWFLFACGGVKLLKNTPLMMEYSTQLDLHALGITALQVLVELLPSSFNRGVPDELKLLRRTWKNYWKDAVRAWEPLYAAFEKRADWESLRATYESTAVHSLIADNLCQLRRALRNVCDACNDANNQKQGAVLHGARPLFAALLELINQGGQALPGEGSPNVPRVTSWATVARILSPNQRSSIIPPKVAGLETFRLSRTYEGFGKSPWSHRSTVSGCLSARDDSRSPVTGVVRPDFKLHTGNDFAVLA